MMVLSDPGADEFTDGVAAAMRLVTYFAFVEPESLRDAARLLGPSPYERGYRRGLEWVADREERRRVVTAR